MGEFGPTTMDCYVFLIEEKIKINFTIKHLITVAAALTEEGLMRLSWRWSTGTTIMNHLIE